MNNLREVKLGDLAYEVSERVANPSESGYERFVGLEHLDSGSFYVNRWGSTSDVKSAMKLFKKGDILFARRNTYLKRASVAEFDGVCSGDIIVLREYDSTVKGITLLIMNLDKFWDFTISNSAGTMSKRAKWRDISELKLWITDIEDQSRWVDKMQIIENLIKSKERYINAVDLYKWKLIKNIIGGEGLNIKTKVNYKYKKLKDIVELHYGDSPKAIICDSGEYNIYGTGGITGKTNSFLYEKESIIIGRKGTIDKPIYVEEPFWAIDTTFYIKPKIGINIKWLYYYINSINLKRYNEATGVPSLNRATLYNIKIQMPLIEIQDKIVDIIQSIEKHEKDIYIDLENIKSIKFKVLNNLMNIKIDV